MKIKKLIILAIVMIIAVVTAVPVVAAPPLHKVTGGGTVDFDGSKETYGFTAIQVDESGNARGNVHFTWHYPSSITGPSPWVMQADVLYLAVNADTGDAWIGGVITIGVGLVLNSISGYGTVEKAVKLASQI